MDNLVTVIQIEKLPIILEKTIENGDFILYQQPKGGVLRDKRALSLSKARKNKNKGR